MLIPQSLVHFLKESPFKGLPTEIQQIIFEFTWDTPVNYYKTITILSGSLNHFVIEQDLHPNDGFAKTYLKNHDSAIEFLYFFTENSHGGCHHQNYKKLPLSPENTINMQNMVQLIRYIACRFSTSVNEIAKKYECFQYIRFHDEFCFRAAVPQSRLVWRSNYKDFFTETCKEYLSVFDENYSVDPTFSNDMQWLVQKIETSSSHNITKITDPDETHGTRVSFDIPSETPFSEYIKKLLKKNKTIPLQKIVEKTIQQNAENNNTTPKTTNSTQPHTSFFKDKLQKDLCLSSL